MLTTWTPAHMPEKEEIKTRLQTARSQLYDFQMKIKEHKIPVIVLFEGWGSSGKGSTIGKVIKNIDPHFFKVATMSAPTAEELRYPFLYRYFKQIPEAGKFTFLDSGWMEQTCKDCLSGEIEGEGYTQRIDSIRRFERQLTDNGYLVLKFFMQIDRDEQKRREKLLLDHKDTRWRVSDFDKWQNEHYKKCAKIFSQINIRQTGNLLQREYILQNRNGMCLILHGNFNIAYHSLQHLKFRPFSVTGIYDVPWCRGNIRVRQILRKYFCTFFVMFILPFIKV